MNLLYTILIVVFLLTPQGAWADHAPRTPLNEKEVLSCQCMEQEHPACNICGETYSESQARMALWIQLGATAVCLGLILAAVWVMCYAACRIRLLGRIKRRVAERRFVGHSLLAPGRIIATLKGPFGTVTADAVDISGGGVQIEVAHASWKGMKGLKDAVRSRTILNLTLAGRDNAPVLKDAACRAVWVCGECVDLVFRDTTDITPFLQASPTPSREPQ